VTEYTCRKLIKTYKTDRNDWSFTSQCNWLLLCTVYTEIS